MLSICMMVKDEENNLDRCLRSLDRLRQNIESELIIVDTGSLDNTVEIANQYTDKVYFHKWNNNFSEMRNITISYAKGKWILIIDADEELKEDLYLIEFLNNEEKYKSYNAASLYTRNFSTKNVYVDAMAYRLFKNDGDFKYIGAVHNQPIFKQPTIKIDSMIFHYGYDTQDSELMQKKFERTSSILKKELKRDPDNIYYRYQLAVSYGMYNKWEEALDEEKYLYKLIERLSKEEKNNYFYIYSHIIISYKKFKMYEEIEKITDEALSIRENDIDINFFKADNYLILENYSKAVEYYKKYIYLIKKYENKEHLENLDADIRITTISFKENAISNLIYILYRENRYEEVLEFKDMIFENTSRNQLTYIMVDSYICINKVNELKEFYDEVISDFKEIIANAIEVKLNDIDYEKRKEITLIFSKSDEDNYSKFNKMKLYYEEKIEISQEIVNDYLMELASEFKYYYSDVFYYNFKDTKNINLFSKWLKDMNTNIITQSLNYIHNKYKDFYGLITEKINELDIKSLKDLKLKLELQKYMLINCKSKYEHKDLFFKYIEDGYFYISKIYNNNVIENISMVTEINNNEHKLYIYMNDYKKSDNLNSLKVLKICLSLCPYMKEWIMLLNEEIIELESQVEQRKKYIFELEQKIQIHLSNGEVEKAKEVLDVYEKFVQGQ